MKQKYDVFISYSRANLEKVKSIKAEIERSTGVRCWMDLEGIESGVPRFTRSIIEGIKQCQIFLFMCSAQSQSSEFALRELNFADKRCPHIVIVHIDAFQMNEEFEFLYGLTDAIDWNNLPQREKLYRDIKKWIGDYKNEVNVNLDKIGKRKKEEKQLCEKCGNPRVDNALYCYSCGHKFGTTVAFEHSPKKWICYTCGKLWADSVTENKTVKCPYCSSMCIAEVNSTSVAFEHLPKKWICYTCGKSWADPIADNKTEKCPYCGSMNIAEVNK